MTATVTEYRTTDLPARIAGKIRIDLITGCWTWTGYHVRPSAKYPNVGGYGYVRWDGQMRPVHRVVWVLLVGPIPEDRPELDHLCHDPRVCRGGTACPHRACCNPLHLEPVTRAVNAKRAMRPPAERCAYGHALDVAPDGTRACQACDRLRADYRDRAERRRAADRVARDAVIRAADALLDIIAPIAEGDRGST